MNWDILINSKDIYDTMTIFTHLKEEEMNILIVVIDRHVLIYISYVAVILGISPLPHADLLRIIFDRTGKRRKQAEARSQNSGEATMLRCPLQWRYDFLTPYYAWAIYSVMEMPFLALRV